MMYEKGNVSTLQAVAERFMQFVQLSNSSTQAWEVVDDRLNSFYGATLRVPVKFLDGDEEKYSQFYISLQHTNVTQSTYSDWLRTGYRTPDYIAGSSHHQNEYSEQYTVIYYQSEKYDHSTYSRPPLDNRSVFGKYGGTNSENAFKNTGDFLAIGLHTLFDAELWMCEQGGITCEKEARNQINNLNLLPWRSSVKMEGSSTQESSHVALPVFPGTGCPWFTISDKNKTDFSISSLGIDYWFTKNDYDATITIRVRDVTSSDVYQSMSFGMLKENSRDTYLFPLYVAGGSQALSQDIYIYRPVNSTNLTYMTGNIYDLNIQNICLSNSNLLTPTKFNGANMSNFRVLAPSGVWCDVYSKTQGAYVKPQHVCRGEVRDWKYFLSDVSHTGIGLSEHSANLLFGYNLNRVDTSYVRNEYGMGDYSSRLEHIFISLSSQKDLNENGILGSIPNCYGSWYRNMPVGEVEIDGKKYLSVPNGWDGRLWNYPIYYGLYDSEQYYENDSVRRLYNKYYNRILNDIIVHRLIIPLEE